MRRARAGLGRNTSIVMEHCELRGAAVLRARPGAQLSRTLPLPSRLRVKPGAQRRLLKQDLPCSG